MKLSGFVSLLCWLGVVVNAQTQWPLHTDGLNSVVEWDHYSFIVNRQRLYIWSGEIHYWRIPVPELWIDVLEKVKAAGFNAISVYGHWGFHSAASNTTDFTSGARDFTKIFAFAKQLGLYVIWRPGPYVNAETTAGGFPGWVTTGAYGSLRNNDTRYTAAWTPYMTKMGQIVAQHLVTNGGNVFLYQIENEYGEQWKTVATKVPNPTAIAYMENLEANARAAAIDIPLSHNNPNLNTKSWSTDYGAGFGGNVDIYGADSYPSCWSCDLSECGSVKEFSVVTYYDNFQQTAPTQPAFLAEFQGGAYLPWSGPEGGCTNNTGPDWVNVFYRHNVGQKVIAQNIYMVFGGTNWGGLAFPKVGTSYDYSAPIAESRVIGPKYAETKLFAQFIRVARDLTKVDLKGNNTYYATDSSIFTSELRNPDTNAGFYVTIHTSSPSLLRTPFNLHVTTSLGNITIPQLKSSSIVLNGRESKIIVTDFKVGSEKLIYSTAEIFTVSVQDNKPLVFLWLPTGESGEFLLTGVKKGSWLKKDGCSGVAFSSVPAGLIVSWTQETGSCALSFNNGYRFVLIDRTLAYDSWVPSISVDPYTPENSTVVVQGPYLVRTVSMEGNTVSIAGDWSSTTTLEVFAPSCVSRVNFNGANIHVKETSYGSLVGTLVGAADGGVAAVVNSLPPLTLWKVTDGLPERLSDYDDSKWIVADHKTTPNTNKPATLPVLYADDYGFHTGNILWRGRFSGTSATGVTLAVMGGTSHGWSAFLNGAFIGSYLGNTAVSTSTLSLSFANATLSNTTNVLFIIQDHMGHDETSGAVLPRGIYNATLLGSSSSSSTLAFTSWRVAGNAGGEANIDPVRGPFAEGGLHGERQGWHLPNYPDRPLMTWGSSTPSVGLTEAGANFYRTVVNLDLPAGLDVSLALVLSSPAGTTVRAQIYVNGYQFGKYVPYIGNQVVFPVYPGILDYHGPNTIALSLWAQEENGGSVSVSWKVLGAVSSSFDPGFKGTDMSYLRPGYSAVPDRLAYY